jgi:type VII secretion-associated serine protease mycosin
LSPDPGWDPATVIVQFRPGVSERDAAGLTAARSLRVLRPIGATGFTLVATQGRSPTDVVAGLREDPMVAGAELNHRRTATATIPNDPAYAEGRQAYLSNLGMPSAWDQSRGSGEVLVAIVDTGVNASHPDLSGKVLPGWDFANDDSLAEDDNGHGTMCAGIVAANTNNLVGVAGVAWDPDGAWSPRILPVKVLDGSGYGTVADVADGIMFAADRGAGVINLSLGSDRPSSVEQTAVEYAQAKGAVVVAAAGNDSSAEGSYPAAYEGVVAVTATDDNGNFAWFSSYGPWVDVAAPGINVTSTLRGANGIDYGTGTGTSFAAPLVSGVAALVRAANPSWNGSLVASQLRDTARDAGPPGIDDHYGHGWLDPTAALGGPASPALVVPPPDGQEPDGTPDTAAPLGTGANGTISHEGDVDWFFTDVTSGGSLTFTVQPPTSSNAYRAAEMDPVIDVYDPALRLLGSADAPMASCPGNNLCGNGQTEQLTVPSPQAGRYYLSVRNFVGSRSPGAYSVSVSASPAFPAGPGLQKAWVRDTSPPDSSSGIAPCTALAVRFARAMEPSSLTAATAHVRDGVSGALVAASVNYDEVAKTVLLTPPTGLASSRPYAVEVAGARDRMGQAMPRLVVRFRTGDGARAVCISDATAGEAGPGTTASFTVAVSQASSLPVTVALSTADATATASGDYVATSQTVSFDPGQTSKVVEVPIAADTVDEVDETFLVNLSSSTNASVGDGRGVGTIIDAPADAEFHPLPPARVLNTVDGTGGSGTGSLGRVGPAQTQVVDVTTGPVPPEATAVVLNVTVTGADVPLGPTPGASYLSVTPSGGNTTSNLNFKGLNAGGQDIAGLVKVPVGPDGNVRIYNRAGSTHVVADVFGYYAPAEDTGARFSPVAPERVLQPTKARPGQTLVLDVANVGSGSVSPGATAVVLNLTVSGTTEDTYLSVTPNGGNKTSNLNARPVSRGGQDIANLVIVPVGTDGKVRIYNQKGAPYVIADLFGYYEARGAPAGNDFTPVAPQRILSTVDAIGAPRGGVGAGQTLPVSVAGVGEVPIGAKAVVLNVTVTGAAADSYLSVTPTGGNTTSNVNFRRLAGGGQDLANLVVVPLGPDGNVRIYNDKGSVYVIADVFGFFGP